MGQRRALCPLLVIGPPPPQHLQELRVELLPQLGHVLAPEEIHLDENSRRKPSATEEPGDGMAEDIDRWGRRACGLD